MNQGPSPARFRCTGRFEREARSLGYRLVAGVDEAGRGSLFGPVFAGAVILLPDRPVRGLRDSKILTAERRDELARLIRERAIAWAVAAADVFEIDRWNIYQASRLAMRRAVERLAPSSDFLLIDALRVELALPQRAIVHGDAKCQSIAAASILAKTARDECLSRWHDVFPEYGLLNNKGYGTPEHLAALRTHGATFLHRFTFEPVRMYCRYPAWVEVTAPEQVGLFDEMGAHA